MKVSDRVRIHVVQSKIITMQNLLLCHKENIKTFQCFMMKLTYLTIIQEFKCKRAFYLQEEI